MELTKARIAATVAFGPALKSARNPHFDSKYVDLHSVDEATRQPLADHGLAVVQTTINDVDGLILVTTLVHTSGEWVESLWPVKPVRNDPQGWGSALTYARRYQLMTVLGIAPEDDDGQAAGQAPRDDRGRDRERGQRRDDRQRPRERRDPEAPRKPAGEPADPEAKPPASEGPAELPQYFAQWVKHFNGRRVEGDPNEFQMTRHLLKFAIANEWTSELHPNPSASEVAAAVATVYRNGGKARELVAEARRYVREIRERNKAIAASAAAGASPAATDGGNG